MAVVDSEQRGGPAGGFTSDCRKCARLARFLKDIGQQYPNYFSRPVPSFGDPSASLLIVGLAPGLHGANATGRPFTGDFAGVLLYETLFRFGFADRPTSEGAQDGLILSGCRITNAVRCVPPQNKPTSAEVRTCNGYLVQEISALADRAVVLALGGIAHGAVLRAVGQRLARHPFGHGRVHEIARGMHLVDSYHCSRYNTQTGRLTRRMFDEVFALAQNLLDAPDAA